MNNFLLEFVCSRGLNSSYFNPIVFNIHEGFDSFGWRFNLYRSAFFGEVPLDNIRNHKRVLKVIVKNSANIDNFSFLNRLNKEVLAWSYHYYYIDFAADVWSELDVYLNKLLWKWARRRHPRRSNSWIYSKYWKCFSGSWKFSYVNPLNGSILFLRSHYLKKSPLYRLPISISVFEFFNQKSVEKCCFKKFDNLISGVARVLWLNQRGLCYCCKRPFNFLSFQNLKLCKKHEFYSNFISNLVLIHSYCKF